MIMRCRWRPCPPRHKGESMRISEVSQLVGASVLCGEDYLEQEVESAFGSDMMSDVLAWVQPSTLIITGMVNLHVIRTAEMLDAQCILFVRDKQVTPDVVERAKRLNMVLLKTKETLFTTCGILYAAGLRSCVREESVRKDDLSNLV